MSLEYRKTIPGFAALALLACVTVAKADEPIPSMSERYSAGLVLERHKDDKGAFEAYLAAAEEGFPPAQRKLAEIYDSGNTAVRRDYSQAIRWYEKARANGEDLPPPKSPIPSLTNPR